MSMRQKNKQILNISGIIFKNIAISLLLILIGIKLDQQLNVTPLFIIICSVLTIVYTIISIFSTKIKNKKE